MGLDIIKTGSIVTTDSHSILTTQEMIYPSWGISLIYAWLYDLTNLVTVSFLHKIALLGLNLMIYNSYLKKHHITYSTGNLILLLMAIIGSISFYIDRPALVATIPLFQLYKLFDNREKFSTSDYLKMFLWTLIWTNIHGSVFLGLIIALWNLISKSIIYRKIQLHLIIPACLIAGTINISPFGFDIWEYALKTQAISQYQQIVEWIPTFTTFKLLSPLHPQSLQTTFYIALLLIVVLAIYRKRHHVGMDILTAPYIPLLLMGFSSIRQTAFSFFFLLPFLTKLKILSSCEIEKPDQGSSKKRLIFTILLIVFTLFFVPYWKGKHTPVYSDDAPIKEAQLIKTLNIQGNIFNQLELGSYLTLMIPNKIFMDARNTIYSKKDFNHYKNIIMAEKHWEDLLSDYNISIILLRNRPFPIIQQLKSSERWSIISSNKQFFLAVRNQELY